MASMGLDHVIYGTLDLDATIDEIAQRAGVRPALGGSHTGRGTRNALLGTGGATYVEVLAPDPAQPAEVRAKIGPRVPSTTRITTWAAMCDDLRGTVARAQEHGLDLGAVEAMSRARPDGDPLHWRLTRGRLVGGGLIPFLIDWGDTDHPSRTAPQGCALRSFRAEHPDPGSIRQLLAILGLEDVLTVEQGPAARLFLTLATPLGEVTLS